MLARGPGRLRTARARDQRGAARGEKGAPRFTLETLAADARAAVHLAARAVGHNDSWFVLTGCRKGSVPARARSRRSGRGTPQPRPARRRVRPRPCARRAVGPRRPARPAPQRRARRGRGPRRCRRRRDQQRALRDARASARSRPRSPRCGPAAPSTSSTAGSPPRASRTCAARPSSCAASPASPARSSGPSTSRASAPSTCASRRRTCPTSTCPPGHTDMSWLRELTRRGAARRYPVTHPSSTSRRSARSSTSSAVIEQLGFPGYFLLLVDIVEFCNRNNIYCQGRGSAANSAVCYALGVTKADAVALGLLFERFLSPERDGPPDIDLDIEHQRREEVIQYVYDKYGRDRAAQVANVITYRPKCALREMAKAVGVSPGQADALTKWIDRWGRDGSAFDGLAETRDAPAVPPLALDLANQVLDYPAPPRHPLRRDGDGRPPAGGVLPGRVGPDGEPVGAPVGQGRLRGRGPGQVRPARARDADDAAPRRRPHRGARGRRDRPGDDPPGARGLRAAVRGRHRRRVPGREPRADGHPAAAAARRPSTTSWWRSR